MPDKLDPLALDLMQRATVAQMPNDAEQRASVLLVLLLQSRDRERRWQSLCFPDA